MVTLPQGAFSLQEGGSLAHPEIFAVQSFGDSGLRLSVYLSPSEKQSMYERKYLRAGTDLLRGQSRGQQAWLEKGGRPLDNRP